MNHKAIEYNGASYDCICRAYQDVIEIMLYKNNRITKVFGCSLVANPGGVVSQELTLANIDPQPLVGSNADDAQGLLYAQIIASTVSRQSEDDFRRLIIGFGAIGPGKQVTQADRDELQVITQLLDAARVW